MNSSFALCTTATMLKAIWLLDIIILCFFGLTCQETIQVLNLQETTPEILNSLAYTGQSVAVSLQDWHLDEVSSSISVAESWLRTHVLPYYPATKVTTIVVGNTVHCSNEHELNKLHLHLACLKNIHHSLTRWGLQNNIKVSVSLSFSCLQENQVLFKLGLVENVVLHVLEFLKNTNSTYSVKPYSKISTLVYKTVTSAHYEFMQKLGSFELSKFNLIQESNPTSRKLSFVEPYPARPSPLREIPPSKIHSSVGYSVPANIAQSPNIAPAQQASPPPLSLSFPKTPELSPAAAPPLGFTLPPCSNPYGAESPVPVAQTVDKLWCVAKPNVPEETLQEAMDYACGEGGADCEEIKPYGNCYYPDTVVAHASYAFNSYWQKNKNTGGTCNFGGTSMIINSDPSFTHCRFLLT